MNSIVCQLVTIVSLPVIIIIHCFCYRLSKSGIINFTMSKRKTVSADEKRERMLQLFHEKKEFFQLKAIILTEK